MTRLRSRALALGALCVAAFMSGACRRRAVANVREARGGPDAVVVATLHSGQLVQRGYPLALLGRLLTAYAPHLVLVEIRPQAFAMRHYEDGPFEMTYVTLVAHARGIAVEPIDWWRESDVGRPDPTLPPEIETVARPELASLEAARVVFTS